MALNLDQAVWLRPLHIRDHKLKLLYLISIQSRVQCGTYNCRIFKIVTTECRYWMSGDTFYIFFLQIFS